jgi:AcrR family transcriptional regulator
MTREKILTAAKELFQEKGFEPTTVREIATLAGVNVALINYHFGSKEQLLAQMVEETTAHTLLRLNDITKSGASPIEKLDQVLELFIERIFSNKQYYQMIHRELSTPQRPELNDQIGKPLKRNRDEMLKIIEEGQKKKVFRKDVDIDLTISTVFGLLYQATHIAFKSKVYDKQLQDDAILKTRVLKHLQEILKNHLVR